MAPDGFAALGASWLFGQSDLRRERRATGKAGVRWGEDRLGVFQLYLSALVGNNIGLERASDVTQVGLGLAWSPSF